MHRTPIIELVNGGSISNYHPTLVNGATDYSLTLSDGNYNRLIEYMDSEPKGLGRWNNCTHYKCGKVVSNAGSNYYSSGAGSNPTWNPSAPYYVWSYPNVIQANYDWFASPQGLPHGPAAAPYLGLPVLFNGSDWSVNLPVDIAFLKENSLTSMLPGIRPKLSLLNSIYELKDFKSLPEQILRAGQTLKSVATALRLPLTNLGTRTVRDILKLGANGYLQYMFNLAPLVSDIKAIRSSISNVRQQVNNLLEREGQKQIAHYGRVLSDDYADSDDVQTYPQRTDSTVFGGAMYRRQVRYVNPSFHAMIEYSYTIPDWQKENALLRGYLDSLGVNLNPRIIWAAIPWSFVIDWVAGIGRWLDQFKTRNLEPQTCIYQYCWSIRIERWVQTQFALSYGSYGGPNGSTVPVLDSHEILYHRVVEAPELERPIRLSGLNSTEFSLAAALGLTRL